MAHNKKVHTPTPLDVNRKGDYWQVISYGKDGIIREWCNCLFEECARETARAVNSYDHDKATIKALVEAATMLYCQYFARIQATARVLPADEEEGKACDEMQKAIAQAEVNQKGERDATRVPTEQRPA